MKYKVGDKVILEAEVLDVNSDNNVIFPYYLGLKNNASYHCAEKDIECISKTYEDGLNDAWELIKKLYRIPKDELYTLFDTDYPLIRNLIEDFTPQQALAKIEAYEKSQQIQVGDVVKVKDKIYEFIVTAIKGDGIQGVDSNGYVYMVEKERLVKTGRHIDIEHLLEQIRGNE